MVMRRANRWMIDNGLSLAPSKTEIVSLANKLTQTFIPMRVGSRNIETKSVAKYLGVVFDDLRRAHSTHW